MHSVSNTRVGRKSLKVREDIHRAAKIMATEKAMKLEEFADDALSAHILRNTLSTSDFEALVQKQKRGSKRGGKAA